MSTTDRLNLMSKLARDNIKRQLDRASELGLAVRYDAGATVIDFAVQRPGTIAAGLALAELCLSGLGQVDLLPQYDRQLNLPCVAVRIDDPLMACIASQYAGWPFAVDEYFAMCSGPCRTRRGRESILESYDLISQTAPALGIFESNSLPGSHEIDNFASQCNAAREDVMICVARTASFPGMIQVVARSVETTLHKLHELNFDLTKVVAGTGLAPLPPLPPKDLIALGWTNDAILYGGCVNLWLKTTDEAILQVLDRLPSSSSPDFGLPFGQIFERYQRDFYKIDKLLFSPAKVILNNLTTGRVFSCGEQRIDILNQSFGL